MKKTEANFYLFKRKDTRTGQSLTLNVPIIMIYALGGSRLEYYTGLRVDAKYWDLENKKVKKGYTDYQAINSELAELKTKAENEVAKAKVLGLSLTIKELKYLLKTKSVIADIKAEKTFWQYFDEYKAHLNVTVASSTIQTYQTTFNVYRKFEQDTNYKLSFQSITLEFYDKFLLYCFNEMDYTNNTVGCCLKNLKVFLNWATENKYNTNLEFRNKSFKKLRYDTEILYLLWDELMYLYNFDLSKHKRIELLRDKFCFGCFTGLRHSDIAALEPANCQNNEITLRSQKTTSFNVIPLNQYSKAIIKKYKKNKSGKLLPALNPSSFNMLFKQLFTKVKLNRKVQTVGYQGTKRIEQTKTIGEAVTFHVSKKTFMTTFLANGGSLETAMAITGNKTYASAKRYFAVIQTKKRDEMNKVFNR
jgi:integrase